MRSETEGPSTGPQNCSDETLALARFQRYGSARGQLRDVERMIELIDQAAREVASQESRLRDVLRHLVQAGQTNDALEILDAWDEMAAGDVLRKHDPIAHDETN